MSYKTIWCAGNRVSSMYFEDRDDADKYAGSCGPCAGVEVWPVSYVLSSKVDKSDSVVVQNDNGTSVELVLLADKG